MPTSLKFALRQLAKAPGFTAIVVLTLALGIGACTAIFSVVHGVVLKPLPYPDAEQVMILGEVSRPDEHPVGGSVAPANYLDWRRENTVFAHLAAFRGSGFNVALAGSEPQRLIGLRVGAEYFKVIGLPPALGRDFTADDDRSGAARVVIVSHALGQRQFGGAPSALGRQLVLNGEPHTIIGVMPEQMRRISSYEFWIPLALSAAETAPERRGAHYINVLGRLRPGVSVEQARSEMAVIADRLAREYPATNRHGAIAVVPHVEYVVGPTRPVLLALLGAVAGLLLIACANVANLLLARATTRAREIAVRTALGASRGRVIGQLLTESLALAIAGGLLGLLFARWGLDGLLWLAPADLPRAREIALDPTVLAFTSLLVLATGIIFGLAPALQLSRLNLIENLKDGARGGGDAAPRRRLRNAFVVAEVALSLALLFGAGLLMRSFARLQAVDPGFNPRQALNLMVSAPPAKYPTPEQQVAVAEDYAARIRALPGVIAAGLVNTLPFGGGGEDVFNFSIDGREPFPPGEEPVATHYRASPGYFEAMGIAVVRGRAFTAQDRAGSTPVVIVSQGFAEKFFPGEDPIGRRLNIHNGPPGWREIVGVVRDVRHLALDDARALQFYEAFAQQPGANFNFVIRTADSGGVLPAALRALVREVDPEQPVIRLATVESLVAATTARQRFGVTLFGVFSALALVLSAIGIYGVVSYSVAQRTAEFGIRMALGARSGDVQRLVLRESARLTTAGLTLGALLVFAGGRLLEALLFNTSPRDPAVLGVIAALLGTVALLASWMPARRAARVDPMIALRAE